MSACLPNAMEAVCSCGMQPLTSSESPSAIDFGPDLRQVESLHSEGRAQLVEEHHGKHQIIKDIRLNGRLATTVELACARCLEPVGQDVKREFDLLYRPLGADAGEPERP